MSTYERCVLSCGLNLYHSQFQTDAGTWFTAHRPVLGLAHAHAAAIGKRRTDGTHSALAGLSWWMLLVGHVPQCQCTGRSRELGAAFVDSVHDGRATGAVSSCTCRGHGRNPKRARNSALTVISVCFKRQHDCWQPPRQSEANPRLVDAEFALVAEAAQHTLALAIPSRVLRLGWSKF